MKTEDQLVLLSEKKQLKQVAFLQNACGVVGFVFSTERKSLTGFDKKRQPQSPPKTRRDKACLVSTIHKIEVPKTKLTNAPQREPVVLEVVILWADVAIREEVQAEPEVCTALRLRPIGRVRPLIV